MQCGCELTGIAIPTAHSMPSSAISTVNRTPDPRIIHRAWLRLTHWLNAIAVILLIASGWRIYNATQFFGFAIPRSVTLGGWLGGALQWHFAAMWLLVVNGSVYLLVNVCSGRLRQQFFPVAPRQVLRDLGAALRVRLDHADLRHYNSVQKLAYLFVMADSLILVVSGLVLWKSVQFPLLRELVGGYEAARRVHFCAMAGLCAFIVVHVAMVALVPRTLLAMLRGR